MKTHLPQAILILTLLMMAGCSDSLDDRLLEFAKRTQADQARQSQTVADQAKQVAEASRHLIETDARARKEMIAAHAALQQELQHERASLDRQRAEMEHERREIARQRHRDPIIAQTIGTIGFALVCMLPLALAGYVVYVSVRSGNDDQALVELLVSDLVAKKPRLLPGPVTTPQLEDKSAEVRPNPTDPDDTSTNSSPQA